MQSIQNFWLQNMILDNNCSDTSLVPLGAVRHDFELMQQHIDSLCGQISALQSCIPLQVYQADENTSVVMDPLPDANRIDGDLFDIVDGFDQVTDDVMASTQLPDISSIPCDFEMDTDFINSLNYVMNPLVDPVSTVPVSPDSSGTGHSDVLIPLPVKISTYSVTTRDTFARAQVANDRFIYVLNSASASQIYEEKAVLQMKSTGKPRDTDEHTRVAAELQFFCKLIHKVYNVPMLGLWQLSLLTDRRCIALGCKTLAACVGCKWHCTTCSLNKKGNKMTWDEGFTTFIQTPHHQRLRHIVPLNTQ